MRAGTAVCRSAAKAARADGKPCGESRRASGGASSNTSSRLLGNRRSTGNQSVANDRHCHARRPRAHRAVTPASSMAMHRSMRSCLVAGMILMWSAMAGRGEKLLRSRPPARHVDPSSAAAAQRVGASLDVIALRFARIRERLRRLPACGGDVDLARNQLEARERIGDLLLIRERRMIDRLHAVARALQRELERRGVETDERR